MHAKDRRETDHCVIEIREGVGDGGALAYDFSLTSQSPGDKIAAFASLSPTTEHFIFGPRSREIARFQS